LNNLVPKKPGVIMQQSSLLANMPLENAELSAGVTTSFPILGIKGGKWHYRWKGEDKIISDERGFPVPAINVVILKSQAELTRTFYPGGFVDGANNRPSCWSSNGIRPDDIVPDPVNPVCATCPNDAWGSGATAAAPKAKACQQRRRVVVVPYGDDLTNEDAGGPMLLSVPPSSLRNMDQYATTLTNNGIQYFGGATQLSFDQTTAFPRIEFSWAGALTDEEVAVVLETRQHEQVGRILNSKIEIDGPEADGDTPKGAKPQAQAETPKGAIPKGPQQTSSVKAAPQPVAPPPQQAAPTKVNLGAAKATQPMPGGFAVKPKATTIIEAVANPAPAPVSTRTVRTAPIEEASVGEALHEDNAHTLPDELNSAFDSLMKP
jgi:hypothetical protein